MLLWNKSYQQFDLVVSSVTTKVKGVAQTHLPGVGDVVWDVVDYSGPSQVPGGPLGTGRGQRQELKDVSFCVFSGQKLVLRGDQRHRDKEPEAGEMSRGALSSSLIFILYQKCCSWYDDSDGELANLFILQQCLYSRFL